MAKSEQPFDKIIKEKLEAYSSMDSPDWHFMQQQIQDAENDLLFDQKIKHVFEDLKVDSQQIQWESFLAKRNRQIARTNKIISARVIESCLVLLLLWTIDNIGITHIIKPGKRSEAIAIAKVNETSMKPESLIDNKSTDPNQHDKNLTRLVTTTNEPKEKGFNRKKINISFSLDENRLHKKLSKPPFINPLPNNFTSEGSSNDNLLIANQVAAKTINSDATESNDQASKNNEEQISSEHSLEIKNSIQDIIINPVDKKINELPIEESTINLKHQLPKTLVVLKPAVNHKSVVLNVHSGMMMNVVISPSYLEPNSDKIYSQLRPGFQTAVNVGFQTKKYMLESGLTYQYLSYEPNQSDVFIDLINKASYKLHFRKITSHIVTIPVLIHFTLLQNARWSVTSKLGLSLSAALRNNFILDTIIPRQSLSADLDNSELNSRVRNPLNQGILDGGDFGINSFSNMVAGIRYQRRFSSNLSFYTEFEISKMIGTIGFGPNGDRFISGSLNTGISIKL